MQNWFIEHGQMSGFHRVRVLSVPKPQPINENLRDTLRSPKKYETQVFLRDGYRCRYCGIKLVSNKLLTLFEKSLNSPIFRKGPTNLDRHGIFHIFKPVADHVIPWSLGGKTNLTNLVTSCNACNYGKNHYTVEQIGITNPYLRKPILDSWDGLASHMKKLKNENSKTTIR